MPRPQRINSDDDKYAGSPIHLTATAIVQPGTSVGCNSQALHSPLNYPIEISDFKFGFNVVQTVPQAINPSAPYLDGAALGVSIGLSDEAITKEFIPIWLLGYSTNAANEELTGYVQFVSTGVYNVYNYAEYVWHLRNPLIIMPTDQLTVAFQHYGQVNSPINARFSAQGRVVPNLPAPATRKLPYAAAYTSKVFQTAVGAADSDTSTEMDLYNQTDDVIRLQRFVGRMDLFINGVDGLQGNHTDAPGALNDSNSSFTADDIAANLMTCQLFTGHGEPIVPYPALFRSVFSGVTRSWELHDVPLEAGDYFIAALTKAVGAANAATPAVYAQAYIGMTGERDVGINDVDPQYQQPLGGCCCGGSMGSGHSGHPSGGGGWTPPSRSSSGGTPPGAGTQPTPVPTPVPTAPTPPAQTPPSTPSTPSEPGNGFYL